jgi:hypothetical protein
MILYIILKSAQAEKPTMQTMTCDKKHTGTLLKCIFILIFMAIRHRRGNATPFCSNVMHDVVSFYYFTISFTNNITVKCYFNFTLSFCFSLDDGAGRWRRTISCQSAWPFICKIPMGKNVTQPPRTPRRKYLFVPYNIC